jgi:hypothetical protein
MVAAAGRMSRRPRQNWHRPSRRVWRSVKYEEFGPATASTRRKLRSADYIHCYNGHRPRSSLEGRPPDQVLLQLAAFPCGDMTQGEARLDLSTRNYCSDNLSHLIAK